MSVYRKGALKYRIIRQADESAFSYRAETRECRVGDSGFEYLDAPYGVGYSLSINAPMGGGRRIEASFEWLLIEDGRAPVTDNGTRWEMLSTRADVSGKITFFGRRGMTRDVINFRGTGYCDTESGTKSLPESIEEWQWGRAHFPDTSAVFTRRLRTGETEHESAIYVRRDGEFDERPVSYVEQNPRLSHYGVRYARRMTFVTPNGRSRLRIKQIKPIESNIYYIRFFSEMNLTLRDGKPRKSIGITEHFSSRMLRNRWLDWLVNWKLRS
jgi:hypothetical protein